MQVFVPDGHRLIEAVFEEFVSRAYTEELVKHVDAYAQIIEYHENQIEEQDNRRGKSSSSPDRNWVAEIKSRYSNKYQLPKTKLRNSQSETIRKRFDAANNSDAVKLYHLRRAAGVRNFSEDEDIAGKSSRDECSSLVSGGAEGYFQRKIDEITANFRGEFISKKRFGITLAPDGTMNNIPAEWWQGRICSEILERLNFEHPDGVMLEIILTSHRKNTAAWRIDQAVTWMLEKGDSAAELNREDRLALINKEMKLNLSYNGMLKAQDQLYNLRPDLKKKYTKSGLKKK